jgi:hypothetical protein
MHLYGFEAPDGWFALMDEEKPELLPEALGPWEKYAEMDLNPGDPDTIGIPTAQCLANVKTHGCHIFQLKMTFE